MFFPNFNFLGGTEEQLGCEYEWCEEIPQIHMVQYFLQYYITVISFPFCTTLITAVFSCVLGDIPQVIIFGSFSVAIMGRFSNYLHHL